MAPQYELTPPFARRSAQMPAASVHTNQVCSQAANASQRERCLESDCYGRKLVMHSLKEPHIHGPNSKPRQVNATAIPAPAAPEKSCTTEIFADCATSIQSESSSPSADVKKKAPTDSLPVTSCSWYVQLIKPL